MKEIISKFKIIGKYVTFDPIEKGHINKTWLIQTTERRYILQSINENVFRNIFGLTNNMLAVIEHLKFKGEQTLSVINTKDNQPYYKQNGSTFRMFEYIENVVTYDVTPNEIVFYEAGKALGRFQKALIDFDASKLEETIPNFHNTPKRFERFIEVLKHNKLNRKSTCEKEIEYVMEQRTNLSKIQRKIENKEIPLRVVHNDPKLSNILFGQNGNGGVLIDLDTVMPGTYLFDFGEGIRTGAATAKEDEIDLSKVDLDTNLFMAYAEAYLKEMHTYLNQDEVSLLTYSAYLMTIENAIRFLTDYLDGDVYFHITRPNQNLDRARTQIEMAKKISTKEKELQNKIASMLHNLQRETEP